eukprot:scaffold9895_cov156-Amphora_coffeaeformis.AAC.3
MLLSSWTLGSVLENGWTTAMPTGIISADALDRASRLVSLSTSRLLARRGTLWGAIAAHASYNTLASLVNMLSPRM